MTRLFLLTATVGLMLPPAVAAQGVYVAPQAVYLSERERSSSIELYNPSSIPVEVTVSTQFGIPVTDSTGSTTLAMSDSAPPGLNSAADWIQAFPRRVVVEPGARQTVRLLARPPAGLPPGEHWTRLIVSAQGGQVPVSSEVDTTRIRIGLDLMIRTIIAVTYRSGPVATGLDVRAMEVAAVDSGFVVRGDLVRTGNAAFVGNLRFAVLDSTGSRLMAEDYPLAVYTELKPTIVIPRPGVPPGRYRTVVSFNTDRPDIPAHYRLPLVVPADTTEVLLP